MTDHETLALSIIRGLWARLCPRKSGFAGVERYENRWSDSYTVGCAWARYLCGLGWTRAESLHREQLNLPSPATLKYGWVAIWEKLSTLSKLAASRGPTISIKPQLVQTANRFESLSFKRPSTKGDISELKRMPSSRSCLRSTLLLGHPVPPIWYHDVV